MRVHIASGYFRRLEGGAAILDTVFEQCCRTTEVDTQRVASEAVLLEHRLPAPRNRRWLE